MRFAVILILIRFSLLSFSDVRVVAVGDMMPGSSYPSPRLLSDKEMEKVVKEVSSLMPPADIRLFNLEGALVDGGKPAKKEGKAYHFAIPTHYGKYLRMMGFNMASINNNHIMDFGWEGCLSTMRTLEKEGIKYTGPRGKIGEFVVNGKRICVIAFGFTHTHRFYSLLDREEAKRIIGDLKRKYDIIVVSFHGGKEGEERLTYGMERFLGEERGNLVDFSRGVIDAGADLVIGHGPHLPRAMEIYKGKLIAYSLGNFFTYGRFSVRGAFGYAPMLYVVLDEVGNFKEGKILPFIQRGNGVPTYDKEGKAIYWMEGLTKLDFPTTPLKIEKDGAIRRN